MQAYLSSQHSTQILERTLNLLHSVAAHLPAALRPSTSLQQNASLISLPNPAFRGAATQILASPAIAPSSFSCHTRPLVHPFSPPTAFSTLAPYTNIRAARRSFHRVRPWTPGSPRPPPDPRAQRLVQSSSPGASRRLSLFQSSPHPSPQTLVQIHFLETVANATPSYVPSQIAYFQALLDTGVPRAYQRVISRWERVLEFDQSNPLLRSDEAFKLYLTALVQSDANAPINQAIQRREQVLASPPVAQPAQPATSTTPPPISSTIPPSHAALSSAASLATNASPSPPDSTPASSSPPGFTPASLSPPDSTPSSSETPEAGSTSSPPMPPLSKSQEIAQSVLAARAAGSSFTSSISNIFGDGTSAKNGANPLLGAAGGGKENPIHVTISEPRSATVYRIVRFLGLLLLSGFFILVVFAVLLENSGLLKAGPQTAEFEPVQGKIVKFSDVHGVDEAKEELQEVVEFLKDPTNFATLGGKLPKGVLLTGPPGTGKTMLARAVAGEAGVPFLFASGSEFDEMFVGIGAKRIRDLFATARKKQPSIIFIDELDAIGSKRSPKDQHYMKQTLNQLLVELDGFQQTEGVIVIAATNFPQTLDQALVRPGRFDRKISVPLPDVKGRVQILKHHMLNVITAPDVDPMIIARGTPGFSGADLQNMVNQAAIQASREGYKFVLLKHFEWAKDRIIMGAERRSTYIDPKAKKLTAYHEGGHALVALYTEGAMPLHKVTCMPRGNALGYTAQLPEDDRFSVSFKEFVAEMDCCMGGRVAEELVYGPENVTSGCISDLARATDVATRMVQNYGYSQKIGLVYYDDQDLHTMSSQKREEIEAEVRSLVEASQNRAKHILSTREEELHRLADALVEYETLNLEEVQKVIKGERIREDEDLLKA